MTTGLLSPTHIAIVLIALLLILGPKRLPQVGHALGRGIREFKEAIGGHDEPEPQPPPNALPESRNQG